MGLWGVVQFSVETPAVRQLRLEWAIGLRSSNWAWQLNVGKSRTTCLKSQGAVIPNITSAVCTHRTDHSADTHQHNVTEQRDDVSAMFWVSKIGNGGYEAFCAYTAPFPSMTSYDHHVLPLTTQTLPTAPMHRTLLWLLSLRLLTGLVLSLDCHCAAKPRLPQN
jgi:hypothetical protein